MVSDSTVNALLGAVVTVVFAFLPFSPVLGGAVAAYLDDADDGLRIGAISGAVAAVPLVLFGLGLASFGAVLLGIGGPMRGPVIGGVLFLVVVVVVLGAYTVGLSGLGGYLGAYLVEEG